jgi:hypothetical protein
MPPTTFYLEQYTRLPLPPKGDQLAGKNVIITGTTPGGERESNGDGHGFSKQMNLHAPRRG